MNKKIRFTKNVEFLRPFIKGLGRQVPLRHLKYVRGYRVKKGFIERSDASIIRYSKKHYTINVLVEELVHRQHQYKTIERALLHFAHELAHLREWEHTPAHFALQSKILLHFADILKQLKVEDHSRRTNTL